MPLDYIAFINSAWNASPAVKQAMLRDLTDALNYQEEASGMTRQQFANRAIQFFILSTVNRHRRNTAIRQVVWDELPDFDSTHIFTGNGGVDSE